MSSLSPYNPRPGDSGAWLVALDDRAGLAGTVDAPADGWVEAFVDSEATVSVVAALCPGVAVTAVADGTGFDPPAAGWFLVTGAPTFVEGMLRRLMGMPPGTARFTILPGAVSVVQFLPDRAMLLRLNDGHALDEPRA